jgi:aspartyl-tRNA(Asn)/glutamyl-tRNA(Gln) amidotransferase subunit C
MSLDDAQMAHLKRLARIELDPDETAAIEHDLNTVLAYFDLLSELDTDGIEPLTRPLPITDALRQDTPEPSLPIAAVEQLAVEVEEEMIRVPRTVEGGN